MTSEYGHFETADRTFVLTADPPRKWRNRHYNRPDPDGDELWIETSNIGDGPIVFRDSPGNVCTLAGWDRKYLYVRDDETNETFCPGGLPVLAPMEKTRTVFHAAYTRIEGAAYGLHAAQTIFVPRDIPLEVWSVTLTNATQRTQKISLFAFAQFLMTGITADGTRYPADNDSAVVPGMRGVFVHNRSRLLPNPGFHAFIATTSPGYAGASAYRDYFTHEDYSLSTPRLLQGWNADNRPGQGPDCAGAVQVSAEILPGANFRADFFIGPTSGPDHACKLLASLDPRAVDAALAGQIAVETGRASKFHIDTGSPGLDALVNHFSKKQMVSYLIDKSGFRDNLQNDMGLAMCDYPVVRANLLRALSSQKPDGDVPHGFRPLNPLPYADKPCWALHCVPWILKESGDLALLDVAVSYFRGEDTGTVWDHLLRAMRFLASKTGAHGLCDQRFADWDDELEPSEKTGARESVMVTQQFCLGLLEMAELADLRGEGAVAEEARGLHARFSHRLNEVAWDGEWFQRTLCEGGYTAGTRANDEGKIYLYCQSWAVLSRCAPEARLRQCMLAADKRCEDEIGWSIVMPPYSKFDDRLGKASSNRPFSGTNGGAYCHAAGFHAVAHAMLGNAEEAWRVIRKVAPGSPWNPLSRSRAEPFSWTNCYEKTPERFGQACLPWRTGTASWFCMAIVEWILGARRNYAGLLIDPRLPGEIRCAHVTRSFRGATFEIKIDNREGRRRGIRRLTLDGRLINGPVLPDLRDGTHHVEVLL